MTPTRSSDERHELDLPQGRVPLESFRPRAADRRPAVLVLHEICGLNDNIRRIAARFADAGYLAAAPDFLAQGAFLACIWRAMRSLQAGEGPVVALLESVIAAIDARADVGKVGVVGFCMGGGFALLLGARERVAVAGVFYGDPRPREAL